LFMKYATSFSLLRVIALEEWLFSMAPQL
jgi:hypothetical protein